MITFENIVKTYRMGETIVRALRGVSCRVEKGEMAAIIGPSGCGKSTMMHIMGCLDTPTSGKYILDGSEVNKLSDSQLANIRNKKIGFIFQSFNLLARTSAVANVELPLLYGNMNTGRRRKALEALERVGLAKRAFHMPNQLSGGEQQRVAIARALVNRPPIILADEPTGNLDSKSSNEIMTILETLNRQDGITIVMVTHEADIAQRADRTISMLDGQILHDSQLAFKGKADL